MISRKSAKLIAEAYHCQFTYKSVSFHFDKDELYGFLYENDFEPWIMNALRTISTRNERGLLDFVMQLHTGESTIALTQSMETKERQEKGQQVLKKLAECMIRYCKDVPDFDVFGDTSKIVEQMQLSLELDGYIYRDGLLRASEEAVISEHEEESFLELLIVSVGLSDVHTLKHHLSLSDTHYQDARWDDSISNSRKVFDGVLMQVAKRYGVDHPESALSSKELDKPVEVREFLERSGLIEKKEKETISSVYSLLSMTGGHPYIARKDQARLMRHLVLTLSQYVLLRLEGALSKSKEGEGEG